MDSHDHRGKLRQLADDLAWLETHCQGQPSLAIHSAHLRLAAALTRNVLGPAAEGQSARPLFVAVVGGAGAGKSTVVNFLLGANVAEANPQAGYTRHPIAYLPAGESIDWPSSLGFLGPLQRVTRELPGSTDEDIYQIVRVPSPTDGPNPLANFVVWDCPDMTTWAAGNYVSRLMEVVGLADVIVYVASDERYNDEVPTQFLHHLIRAGKAVVVCLTKAREEQSIALAHHFQSEVLDRLPSSAGSIPPIPITAIPQLPPEIRSDPTGKGVSYRIQLLNQLLVLCPTPEAARARTVQNALRYLETAGEGLLDVVRRDLTELETWQNLVDTGRRQFEERYRQEFLAGESFRRFDRTREQVLEMLELTGPAKYLSAVLALLRLPYRYARDFLTRVVVRPAMPSLSEQSVCTAALNAWLDGLQAEALRRSGTHPIWKQITRGFDAGLKLQAQDWFGQVFRTFELKESDELDQAARALPERLANSPALLNSTRLAIVALDLAVVGAVIWFTWMPSVYQLLLIPLAVSLSRQVVELAVRQVVDAGRNRVRAHRERLVGEYLSGPLSKWLADWPTSGGSAMERLQIVLRRVPQTIRDLAGMIPKTAAPIAATPEPAAS